MKTYALTLKLLLIFTMGYAQNNEPGNWLIYFGNLQINEKWNMHHEVQYRNFNLLGDTEQLLLRSGIGFNLSENNNILIGYGFIYSEPYIVNTTKKTNFNEHRIFQQFITRQNFNRLTVQHRYRFEQRFIEDDFRLRLRYFIGLNYTLNKTNQLKNTIYLSAYNELFINTDENYFDRNRLYGGLGYRFSKNFRVEVGIMNQTLSNTSRNQLNMKTFINF